MGPAVGARRWGCGAAEGDRIDPLRIFAILVPDARDGSASRPSPLVSPHWSLVPQRRLSTTRRHTTRRPSRVEPARPKRGFRAQSTLTSTGSISMRCPVHGWPVICRRIEIPLPVISCHRRRAASLTTTKPKCEASRSRHQAHSRYSDLHFQRLRQASDSWNQDLGQHAGAAARWQLQGQEAFSDGEDPILGLRHLAQSSSLPSRVGRGWHRRSPHGSYVPTPRPHMCQAPREAEEGAAGAQKVGQQLAQALRRCRRVGAMTGKRYAGSSPRISLSSRTRKKPRADRIMSSSDSRM